MILFIGVLLLGFQIPSSAKFARYQTKEVPIDRLFTNLQQRLAADTNNFELTYDLARLHSMAYSTNLVSMSVRTNTLRPQFYHPGFDAGVPRGVESPASAAGRLRALDHLTNAILLYERAILLLKKSTNAPSYKGWLILPVELGRAWCIDQTGNRTKALEAYRKALAIAWKREVEGDFDLKLWLTDKWDLVKSGRNPLTSTSHRGSIGPGVCYSEEIIGYMLKLLDPVRDAKEIADLKADQKTLSQTGRAMTPILVPLGDQPELSDLVDEHAAVAFDLDGSGLPRKWGWITDKGAWLVYDRDGNGHITSALQLFGNVTFWIFWRDGYAALRSLDDDGNGSISGRELTGIALWHDANGNGVSDPGEVRPVADWGIIAISCSGEADGNGGAWSPTGITLSNGQTRPTYDWIAPGRPVQE